MSLTIIRTYDGTHEPRHALLVEAPMSCDVGDELRHHAWLELFGTVQEAARWEHVFIASYTPHASSKEDVKLFLLRRVR